MVSAAQIFDPREKQLSPSCYSVVALEYYDPQRHPTCVNFRAASAIYLTEALDCLPTSGMTVDIGAGLSLAAELFIAKNRPLSNLVLCDGSREMLAYSRVYIERGVAALVGDAQRLPFTSSSVALLISSLGDPYNVPAFWHEVSRCLVRGGFCLFTFPSQSWARSFRLASKNERPDSAYFELKGGRSAYVPSFVYSTTRQKQMIECAGLEVLDISSIYADKIPQPHSAKIA
jgi:Methyltransferase domain